MPPSSNLETQPIPVNSSSPPKQGQEQQPSSFAIPTKKGRKNGTAKDGGGVSSVTKVTSKMPESSKPTTPSIPPRFPSSETKSVPAASNGITSPLLEALSSNAFTNSTTQNTNEWAKNVPAYSTSPGNLIVLNDSPPTEPSSYDERSTLAGWNQRERGTPTGHLPSASPPNNRRRPLSFQMEGHQGFEDQASQRQPYMYRRSSMYSQHPYQPQRYPMNPPPPHQPQAHFHGAPDIHLGLPLRTSGLKPGTQGYYCSIDSLNVSGIGPFKQVDSLVISGYEGGVDVYGISRGGLEKISTIDDLRGGVYNAKILPWTVQDGPHFGFPLIVMVLHGPVIPSSSTDPEHAKHVGSDNQSIQEGESVRGSPREIPSLPQPGSLKFSITHYQTTVEVYSMVSKKHVATLLSLPTLALNTPITSRDFTPPSPVGALSISADAGNILITSGTSGEVWIYRQIGTETESPLEIRCIGKVWTSIHHFLPKDSPVPSEHPDSRGHFNESQKIGQQHRNPLLSLKGRWFAYSPSRATSQVSLRAQVPSLICTTRPPGVMTQVPPQLPAINCAVDMLEEEKAYQRYAREIAQSSYDAARWVSDQAIHSFKTYWNKSSGSVQSVSSNSGNQPWHGSHQIQLEAGHTFPPTHGEALQQSVSNAEPILISILDLDKLASYRATSSSSVPHPMSTFKAPLGCSFISFAPSGLALFTASNDGKLQFVWDLMRMQYTKSSVIQAPHLASLQGQHVRQVAMFTRLSPCNIIDVVWTMPHGERLAVITGNNTSHFLNMPSSAFAWPPLRRRIKPTQLKALEAGELVNSVPLTTRAWKFAQPLMNIPRPPGMSGASRSSISATAVTAAVTAQGGRALASGISRSVGAATETIGRFYRQGENKLHGNSSGAVIRSAKWTRAQEKDSLSCVLDGVSHVMINTYRIKQRMSKSKGGKYHLHVGSNPLSYTLPSIPDQRIAPVVQRALDMVDDLDLEEKENDSGIWDPENSSAVKADIQAGTESSIPQAEIESNAPYQPFHTDRRVALHVYSTFVQPPSSPSVSALLNPMGSTVPESRLASDDTPWVFGKPLNTVRLETGLSLAEEDELISASDHRALPPSAMERVTTKIPEMDEDSEQIVVTTRRRKGASRGITNSQGLDDDGFFEDDCEVLDFASQRV